MFKFLRRTQNNERGTIVGQLTRTAYVPAHGASLMEYEDSYRVIPPDLAHAFFEVSERHTGDLKTFVAMGSVASQLHDFMSVDNQYYVFEYSIQDGVYVLNGIRVPTRRDW